MSTARLQSHSGVPGLASLLAAWRALDEAGDPVEVLGEPVAEGALRDFEAETGLALPPALRALYEISGEVIELSDVGIALDSWPPDALARSETVQEPVDLPTQLYVIGDDLGDDVWTIRLTPPGVAPQNPIVVMRDYDPFSLVVAASGLVEFLRLVTATDLIFNSRPGSEAALRALGVPEEVREPGDEATRLDALARWADPALGTPEHFLRREGVPPSRLPAVIPGIG